MSWCFVVVGFGSSLEVGWVLGVEEKLLIELKMLRCVRLKFSVWLLFIDNLVSVWWCVLLMVGYFVLMVGIRNFSRLCLNFVNLVVFFVVNISFGGGGWLFGSVWLLGMMMIIGSVWLLVIRLFSIVWVCI